MATAQNTLSFFCLHTRPARKKMKECFLQRFVPLRSKLLKKIVNKLFNILHHKQNLILSLRQLKAGATL